MKSQIAQCYSAYDLSTDYDTLATVYSRYMFVSHGLDMDFVHSSCVVTFGTSYSIGQFKEICHGLVSNPSQDQNGQT